jgi:SulP family sulfate permease
LRNVPAYFARPAEIIRHYRREDLRPDMISGLTVAIILLPQAIAYALIAELPPQMGLYAAIVAAIVGALWGSSSHLHTGPTNAASLLVLSSLAVVAAPGSPEFIAAAGLMAVMVGVARLLMGLARLGVLVNFVSVSVIVGFTGGAGVLIAVNQLRHLLRLDFPGSADFIPTLSATARHLPETHGPSLVIGISTMAVILLVRRLKPRWPAALVGMMATAAVVGVLRLHETNGVIVLGELPRGLPPLAKLPLFDIGLIGRISTGALAISAIGLVEAVSIARSIASQNGQRLDSNQELVGQGLANIAAGFFSGYTCSGSFTRSAVTFTSGGRTALASAFSGLWTLLALLLLAPLAAYLPRAALAGVLFVTAYFMIEWGAIRRILRASRGDSLIMIATFLATLFLPLEFAVLAGILVSMARFIVQTSMPGVYSVLPDADFRHLAYQPGQSSCLQLAVMTIQGPLYFGAAHHCEEAIRANLERNPHQRFLLLKMNTVDYCDVSGIQMLESIVRLYRQRGGDVFAMRASRAVRERMKLTGFEDMLGQDHFLKEDEAIGHLFYRRLDPAVCIYECPVRVWQECQNLPKHVYPGGLPLSYRGVDGPVADIEPQVLWHQLRQGESPPLVIDVREPAEFKRGHIPNAQLVPMPRLLAQTPDLPADRPIVFVCRTGRRGARVVTALKEQGYSNIRILRGGMLAWEAAGLLEAVDL